MIVWALMECFEDSRSVIVTTSVSVFFFQAEDGIRDYKVTGVQTCALPISLECLKRLGRDHAITQRHSAERSQPSPHMNARRGLGGVERGSDSWIRPTLPMSEVNCEALLLREQLEAPSDPGYHCLIVHVLRVAVGSRIQNQLRHQGHGASRSRMVRAESAEEAQ